MRILKNIVAFLLFLSGSAVLLFFALPKLDPAYPIITSGGKDVPLPTMIHPLVKEYKEELIIRAKEKGIDVVITDGHRSEKRQKSLYEQGRSSGGQIVTNAKAGESYHNYGLAIDFALRMDNGEVVWDIQRDDNQNGKSDWREVAAIAKDLGFEWGGDWNHFKDYPHLQMDFGLTIRDLKRGQRPAVPREESYVKK